MKYLVVSKDPRLPADLAGIPKEDIVVWDAMTFIEKASEGATIDEALYFNLDSLTKDLYDALQAFKGSDLTIIYYMFDDQDINIDFNITEDVYNYVVKQKEEPTQEKIEEKPTIELKNEPNIDAELAKIESSLDSVEDSNLTVATAPVENTSNNISIKDRWESLIEFDSIDVDKKAGVNPAKVYLFGSSKGGTGKTFTCLLSLYRYAKTHPREKIALADFDIIDGQVGISLQKVSPTMLDYYKQYRGGNIGYDYLSNCKVIVDKFGPNVDFYLAPPSDIPEVTNNEAFWKNVFELLILNYDVVFFDSGIDYLGKPPISSLYKIADKIILTCNTSPNSVKSVQRQIMTLSGVRDNVIFTVDDRIAPRLNVVLTRASSNKEINKVVIEMLNKYAPIIAAFGKLDELIDRTQWNQEWDLWDLNETNAKIISYIDKILEM